jgi:hypothetical protein
MGCPSSHILNQRKEEEGGFKQVIFPFPPPRLEETRKTGSVANKIVSSDKIVR